VFTPSEILLNNVSVMLRIDRGRLFYSLISLLALEKNDCKSDVVDTDGIINWLGR